MYFLKKSFKDGVYEAEIQTRWDKSMFRVLGFVFTLLIELRFSEILF
jgi:hypothetical protein